MRVQLRTNWMKSIINSANGTQYTHEISHFVAEAITIGAAKWRLAGNWGGG